MRKLKFRAWNKAIKSWVNMDNLHHIEFIDNELKRRKGIEITQYTGKKDKNGKEIYEGDIVRHQNGYMYIAIFDEINAKWCLVQPRKKDGNTLERVYTGGMSGQNIWRCEVIGNIYENPELLKGGLK